MPQFDFSHAMPQFLWLVLVFGILYLSVLGLYPRVERVVESRKARISADLLEAEAAHQAAEAASSGGTSVLADARARSLAVTNAAREKAADATRQKLAAVDLDLDARADAAAQSLANQRDAAAAELDRIAADASIDLVKRIAGLDVSNDEAAKAVKKVAA